MEPDHAVPFSPDRMPLVPILGQINPVHAVLSSNSSLFVLLLPSYLHLGRGSVLFTSELPSQILYASLLFPCVQHTLFMSSSLIWSPVKYLVSSTVLQSSLNLCTRRPPIGMMIPEAV